MIFIVHYCLKWKNIKQNFYLKGEKKLASGVCRLSSFYKTLFSENSPLFK